MSLSVYHGNYGPVTLIHIIVDMEHPAEYYDNRTKPFNILLLYLPIIIIIIVFTARLSIIVQLHEYHKSRFEN